ncbi:hypothetical protein RUM43_009573 [Polyplax serrata]|uniref:Uncharacterized protein n=1 Tax=Polyplax serrata TaxID=468196 RepID=A0AAN8NZR4_POLSC
MKILLGVILVWWLNLVLPIGAENSTLPVEESKVLSRRRRYIVFPKGSSLQLVFCNTYLFRPVVDIFRFGTTVGLAWQLPDDPMIFSQHKKKHQIYKRAVLKKMEAVMDQNGSNGQQCVLKALCESGQRTPSKKDFIVEVLHKIFSFHSNDEDEEEETHEDRIYRKAHNSVNQNCDSLYPECNISIFKSLQ